MGIFDFFSSGPGQQAAADQQAALERAYAQASDLFNKQRGALTTNFNTGFGDVTNLTDTANSTVAGYGGNAIGALTGNYGKGLEAVTGAYGAGLQPVLQNYKMALSGTGALADALGLNGPEGNTRATQAFWNNPAIQSQLDIGSQNVLRNQAATGQLNSGATNIDLQNLGQQVASQGWNNYVSSLSPYLNFSGNTANNVGQLYSGLGGALQGPYGYAGLGTGVAGVNTGLGSTIGSNLTGLGNTLNTGFQNLGGALAGSLGTQANAAYGTNVGIGNAQAGGDLAAYNASGNFWNTLLGGANAIAKMISPSPTKAS